MINLRLHEVIEAANKSGNPNLQKEVAIDPFKGARALMKRGFLEIAEQDLHRVIRQLGEDAKISIEQHDQMLDLLARAGNGKERITQFIRKKGLFRVL
ncbi:MAG: hypothetical protein AAF990_17280 [Bacteroidota bacterium]